MIQPSTPLLEVDDLHVQFQTYSGAVHAVRGVSFSIHRGEKIAIVGESGCGKSVTAYSIMGLLPRPPAETPRGSIRLSGKELLNQTEANWRKLRGRHIGMVFQDPMTSLNPTMRIGEQIIEGIRQHEQLSKADAKQRVLELLASVGIPHPKQRMNQYPHEFSGGMRQRVIIAIALACRPGLLIADEPTTALDVTIQDQILQLLRDLNTQQDTSLLLITHDLGIVAGLCDRVLIMYAGQIMESGTVDEIFSNPQHPYTKALLQAVPRLGMSRSKPLQPIHGSPPNLRQPPRGCPFAARCPYAMQVCTKHCPPLQTVEGHSSKSACWLHHEQAKEPLSKFRASNQELFNHA